MKANLIIDFDSTMVQVETLEELASVVLSGREDADFILEEMKKITNLGMEGKISFADSLSKRLAMIELEKKHIQKVQENILSQITPSFLRNKSFLQNNGNNIFIISGGFRKLIEPVAKAFQIPSKNILANDFIYNQEKIIGIDPENFLAMDGGKIKAVASLNLAGKTIAIGDGHTDFQIKVGGGADHFLAFTENVYRPDVVKLADDEVKCFEEVMRFLEK